MEGSRAEHSDGTDGMQAMEQKVTRPGIVTKKMLVISSICGGIALLLWVMLEFPRKFKKPKILNDNTCSEDETICPQDWNQISNNCFFQSERAKTWIEGQENCIAYRGSLAIFNSKNEVEMLMPHLGTSSYWIGLKKLNASKPWMWVNGDAFSNWFNIEGSGTCAFMLHKRISSTNCDNTMKYICGREPLCP
ncbi:early activation antigen CD69-like isoform X1 [Acinonyx jubatus]|uniref:Early activation antigen CD69-like isoform X1 n=2 Tax=Acinonyx jubatus TaxID=32536 RepID=A0A6I9ZFQ4_ACIJB|nr:early activation antigen CD69-like isoform X1 [Acinonyx jubatus]